MVLMSRGFRLRDSSQHAKLLAEIEVARVCERFHALPSQVLAEDTYTLRRVVAILDEINRIQSTRNKGGAKGNNGR
jgi:hypothetical protein